MKTRLQFILTTFVLILVLIAAAHSGLAQASRHAAPTSNDGGAPEPPTVILLQYATGLVEPVDITHSGATNDQRLFIVQKNGQIMIVEGGVVQPTPYLNIDGRVTSGGFEQGLLGLTFDPDFQSNGHFYVNYTHGSGDTRISRFTANQWDDDTVDPNTELILMDLSQPFANHNGGALDFGSDGYLYIALGDGGSGGDPLNQGQLLTTPLGKILRIDVHSGPGSSPDCKGSVAGNHYTVPGDNPFAGGGGGDCDEIWAWGLRNPWRMSFDRDTGDLYIADVGQSSYEEVNHQPSSSSGGENYGWRCYEGDHPFNLSNCNSTYVFPVAEYDHSLGTAVTGGYVYRGALYPEMDGNYFFADYGSGRLWSLLYDGSNWKTKFQGRYQGRNFSTFGEDTNGELYVADISSGVIYQIHYLPDRVHIPIIRKN